MCLIFQIIWLNDYHKKVREKVTPLLGNNSNIVDWLHKNTEAISKPNECEPTTTIASEITTTSPES